MTDREKPPAEARKSNGQPVKQERKLLKRFRDGQRVIVLATAGTQIEPTAGTVWRLRRQDDGAWVHLDRRLEASGVHPFPADDQNGRATSVLAYPEECYAE